MKKTIHIILIVLFVSFLHLKAQTVHVHVNNFTTRDGLASNVVNTVIQDRQGYLWLGTNQGLTRFDGHSFANFYVEESGESVIEGIAHIKEDTVRNKLFMSGKDYRLLCFDLSKMCFVKSDGMKSAEDDNLAEEAAYTARAVELGIQRGNITNRRHDLHYVKMPDGREIFTTIDNGFYLYDPAGGEVLHFTKDDAKPLIESDYINDVFMDRSGSIWLATTFAGVYQLDFDDRELIYHNLKGSIRSFAQLYDGAIAVGDMDGNVYSFNPYTHESTLLFNKGHRAYAMRADIKGRLWVATRGGGVWIDDRHLNATDGFESRQVYDICFDHNGHAWIGTFDKGLIEVKENADGSFSYAYHLKGEKIHQLLVDYNGRIWMATENGLFRKDGASFRHLFDKGKVVCVTQGTDGTVYAGSNGYGLLIVDGDKVERFTTSDGLANNCVEAVVADDDGNVICATDQGISVINRKQGTARNVYSPLGLMSDVYNEDAVIKTDDNHVFIGSQLGLVELKVDSKQIDNHLFFAPHITCVYVNDEPLYYGSFEVLQLSHSQNNLRINFSSFNYKNIASVLYSFWLEGVDSEWRRSTKENFALYTNLHPGTYRFHVRYSLAGGLWSEESVCEISISQPWYWTWWARIAYLLLAVLFVWYEYRQYQQRLTLRRQLDQRLSALYAVEVKHANNAVANTEVKESASQNPEDDGREMPEKDDVFDEKESEREKALNSKNRAFLDKLDYVILQNLEHDDLDVNFMANEMCVSYSTLHRRIKSITGMSAKEYVRKHRLTKAMQQLRDGHAISEVYMQCGFSSPSYFTRCFKAEFGLLPSEV